MRVSYFVAGATDADSDTELITTNGPIPREGETVVYLGKIWRVDRVIYAIYNTAAHETAISLVAAGESELTMEKR